MSFQGVWGGGSGYWTMCNMQRNLQHAHTQYMSNMQRNQQHPHSTSTSRCMLPCIGYRSFYKVFGSRWGGDCERGCLFLKTWLRPSEGLPPSDCLGCVRMLVFVDSQMRGMLKVQLKNLYAHVYRCSCCRLAQAYLPWRSCCRTAPSAPRTRTWRPWRSAWS